MIALLLGLVAAALAIGDMKALDAAAVPTTTGKEAPKHSFAAPFPLDRGNIPVCVTERLSRLKS